MKKCKKCGAPLEGFLYNTIGKLMGIKPSEKDPETCNKCEEEASAEKPEIKEEVIEKAEEVKEEAPEPVVKPVEIEEPEKIDLSEEPKTEEPKEEAPKEDTL